MEFFTIALPVFGKLLEGAQGYQQGRYEAEVAGANAKIADANAATARQQAGMAEEAQRREAAHALGRAAAAGAQINPGGPGQGQIGRINTESATNAELDALNIRYSGDLEGRALNAQADMFRMERKAANRRAKGAAISGVLGAAAAGLSGYSDYRGSKALEESMRVPRMPTTPGQTRAPGGYRRPGLPTRVPRYPRHPMGG